MSLTRRQRNLAKLNAVKARKKLQSAQAAKGTQLGEKSDDISEVKVGDSKLDNKEELMTSKLPATDENGETYPDNITDSPISSRADDDDESTRKVTTDSPTSSYSEDDQEPSEGLLMPPHDDGQPIVLVDSREDGREVRRSKLHKHLSKHSSQGANDNSTDAQIASEGEIDSAETNKASPLRRFDIVEGSFSQKGRGDTRAGKGTHKKSSKAKLSEKHRKSRRMRRDHPNEDDTSSFDSHLEPWMKEGRGNLFTSALDLVFDYFDEMRSVGDESYSIRTEKTEETVQVAPRRSPGTFFADFEGIFTEGFTCGSIVAACESLNTPTYSFHEDESTLSGTRESKEAMDSNASRGRTPTKSEGDSRSEPNSFLPDDDDVCTTTSAANDEYKLPNETKAPERGKSVTCRKPIDTQYQVLLRDMCFVPVDCLDETPKIKGIEDDSLHNKLQQLVQGATDQATNISNNFNSDVNFDIGQHSLDTYNSLPCVLAAPETVGESHQPTAEKSWTQTFLSSESLRSHLAEMASVETQSVAESSTKEPSNVFSDQRCDVQLEDNNEEGETDDRSYLYAVGQSIKTSASFFSLDTKVKADTPKTPFKEAVTKLREINPAPVKDRIREIGGHVKDILTCSSNVNPHDSSGLKLPATKPTISISMENIQNICACIECHASGTEPAAQDANVVALGDPTTDVVTSAMNMAKPSKYTDQTCAATEQAEWTPLQDWDDSFPVERYSADAIPGVVFGDMNAEPAGIPSSTISTMDGFSSVPTGSATGGFEETPLEKEPKPRRKWEPISKVPTTNVVRTNGTLTKSTMLSSVTSGQGTNDENVPNRKSVIPTVPRFLEQSSTHNVGLSGTCHPFVSIKAKRQAWRNTQADDFVDIMSANARADDWKSIGAGR